jgi:hypothetical protein
MRKFKHQLAACATAATVFIILGSGCDILRPSSLETAINSFYRAEQTNDWEKVWSFCASTFKQHETKEKFIAENQKGREQFRIVSWKVLRIEDVKAPLSELGPKITRAVKVPMDVTLYDKVTKTTKKEDALTDYWIQENGKWLWHWREFQRTGN